MNTKPHTLSLEVFVDDRGVFAPFFDVQKLPELVESMGSVRRVYYVYNPVRGTVRGFHYHEKEWKVFLVVSGSAKFVAINPSDPKDIHTFVSSDRKNNVVVVPPRYANGWVSLEDATTLVCVSNLTTTESKSDDKRFDPYQWGNVWEVKGR